MLHLGGCIYVRRSGSRSRYYFRGIGWFIDKNKHKDKWIPLGSNLDLAREKTHRLKEQHEAELRGEPTKPDLTLAEGIEWYIHRIEKERHLLAWKEAQRHLLLFKKHVGDVYMRSISRDDVEQFLADRKQEVKPITVNSALRDIKRMFNAAVDGGYLEKNPVQRVKAAKVKQVDYKLPSEVEVERLMQAASPLLKQIILLLVSTGARLSEVLALDWSDIDFTKNTLKLRRRKVDDELDIPMTQRLKKDLWSRAMENNFPTRGLLFPGKREKPISKEWVWRMFKRLVRKLGWPWLTLKTLRHWVATEVWRRTRDLRAVQKLLGHSTLRMSENYMHGDMEARERAVEALDGFLKPSYVTKDVTNQSEEVESSATVSRQN